MKASSFDERFDADESVLDALVRGHVNYET
jgi:hypothetical protein